MRKLLLSSAAAVIVCLNATTASATANFVYHEQTANFVATPTCPSGGTDTSCGRYVENTDRSGSPGFQIYSPETYTLHFKVEFQFFTNQARVYYTTLGDEAARRQTSKALQRATGFLRRHVGDRLQLRRVPELQFQFDESVTHQDRVEQILRELHDEDEQRKASTVTDAAEDPHPEPDTPSREALRRVNRDLDTD